MEHEENLAYMRALEPMVVSSGSIDVMLDITTITQAVKAEADRILQTDAAIRNRVLYEMPKIRLKKEVLEGIEETMERVRRRAFASCGIPARHCGVMARNEAISEQSLSELLEEIEGKKEDNMDSLMDRKIKKVVIECEDGSTYEGSITRIEGNPYNLRSTLVEAKISNRVAGHYGIKEVIFANPSTIVKWTDGTETVVTCQDNIQTIEKKGKKKSNKKARTKPMPSDSYSKEVGLAMCIAKKWAGNQGNYNNIFRKYIEGYTEGKK